MKYVSKVAEAGSLTEAAKLLSVSQAALSTSISQLEGELGVDLFARKGRGFLPTEDGMRFLALSERVLDDVGEIERKFKGDGEADRELNISTMPFTMAERPFITYLNSMNNESVRFVLESAKPSRIARDVGKGIKSLGILYRIPGFGHLLDSLYEANGVEFHDLCSLPLSVYVGANHPLALRDKISARDLKAYPAFGLDQYVYLLLVETGDSYGPVVEWRDDVLVSRGITPIDDLLAKVEDAKGYVVWANAGCKASDPERVRCIPFESDEKIVFGYIKKKGEEPNELEQEFLARYKAWLED